MHLIIFSHEQNIPLGSGRGGTGTGAAAGAVAK